MESFSHPVPIPIALTLAALRCVSYAGQVRDNLFTLTDTKTRLGQETISPDSPIRVRVRGRVMVRVRVSVRWARRPSHLTDPNLRLLVPWLI